MKLIIDIPNRIFDGARTNPNFYPTYDFEIIWKAIVNGTILPEGHWIHRTQDGGCFWEECSVCHTERAFPMKYCPDCGTYMYADIRTDAPTIIEADKAESEDKE